MKDKNIKISIIGLGYVGLPLAVAFAEKFRVIGYDTDQSRIKELNNGNDITVYIEGINFYKIISGQYANMVSKYN